MARAYVGIAGLVGLAACYQGGSSDGGGSSETTSVSATDPTADSAEAPTDASDPDADADADATNTTPTATTPDTSADGTDTSTSATTDPTTSATTDPTTDTGDDDTTTGGGPVVPPCPYDAVAGSPAFDLEVVASGLDTPLFAIGHPTEPDRLFVLEMGGTIRMFEPGSTTAVDPPVLDIDAVLPGGERGLLGLAFHPDFPDDPRIYVDYTAEGDGRKRIEEYVLDPANDYVGDPDSARIVVDLFHPETNHNGGGIAFQDGWLVIGEGDGGTSSTSRNTGVLMSKFWRIGVEPDGTPDDPVACDGCPQFGPFDYTIPADNPFVDDDAFAPEIWAWGFRNPWRWSIDVATGDLWLGDVGAGAWEEIDIVQGGRDYGWVDMEGFHCYGDGSCDETFEPNGENADGITMPIFEVSHANDCAIIGGAVYRSCQVPEWDGIYVYTDYCNNDVRALRWDGVEVEDLDVIIDPSSTFLGNGWNAWGDVYFTGGSFEGEVTRLVPAK